MLRPGRACSTSAPTNTSLSRFGCTGSSPVQGEMWLLRALQRHNGEPACRAEHRRTGDAPAAVGPDVDLLAVLPRRFAGNPFTARSERRRAPLGL